MLLRDRLSLQDNPAGVLAALLQEVRTRHLASGAVVRCGERIAADLAPYYHGWGEQAPRGAAGSGGARTPGGAAPRVLVILTGTARGGAATWRALHRNVLEPSGAALMLVVSQPWLRAMQNEPNHTASLRAARALLLDPATYVVGVPEFTSWAGLSRVLARPMQPSRALAASAALVACRSLPQPAAASVAARRINRSDAAVAAPRRRVGRDGGRGSPHAGDAAADVAQSAALARLPARRGGAGGLGDGSESDVP